jgi:putative DNA methylase
MSGVPITYEYIRAEAKAGRLGAKLLAIVAEGKRGRIYLSPSAEHEVVAQKAKPEWKPDIEFFQQALGFRIGNYGMTKWSDLFTPRQTVALATFSELVGEASNLVERAAAAAGLDKDRRPLREGGLGALAYSQAIALYLAFAVSRLENRLATVCVWNRIGEKIEQVFKMQVISMTWDFPETNVFSDSTGGWSGSLEWVPTALEALPRNGHGEVAQENASTQSISEGKVISTDPPYYDNVGYADLSDFFYVWLRHSLRAVFPDQFGTLSTPKAEELVATPDRHGGKESAEAFFLDGMTKAMHRLAEQSHPAFPVTIYYAFKQSETGNETGTASTGWETFLDAVIRAGFAITGTWPVKTERRGGVRDLERNALASSIVLVCRPRPMSATTSTRREFVNALKAELPAALAHLQRSNIAPVDLAQAAIGPGMAIYTRYSKVMDAAGQPLTVREALALINESLDQVLAEQEGDFDAGTRWAVAWFEQQGFSDGEFGVAETLSKAKNTSVAGMVEAGILLSKRGKVRLLKPVELPDDWDPAGETRLSAWATVHQLIRALEAGGESAAASLVAKLGTKAEIARELAYRLYTVCERKKRAAEALSYNALVQSWPEIMRLARETSAMAPEQSEMFR